MGLSVRFSSLQSCGDEEEDGAYINEHLVSRDALHWHDEEGVDVEIVAGVVGEAILQPMEVPSAKSNNKNKNRARYLEPSCGDDGGEDILELSRALVVARAVLAVQFQERHLEPTEVNGLYCSWQVW
jgi:hypothetical protein